MVVCSAIILKGRSLVRAFSLSLGRIVNFLCAVPLINFDMSQDLTILTPRVRMTSMVVGYVVWLVVVVSMRVAYDPWPTVPWPTLATPTVAEPVFMTRKETTVTKNITGCIASSLLFICEDRGKELWIPQESALMYPPPPRGYPQAEMVEREASAASGEPSDLMFLLPLLILNGAFAYAGSRPKSRLPKPTPSPPVICKEARRQQFAYLHSAETGKAMRRGNRTNAPPVRVMAANRGARGF